MALGVTFARWDVFLLILIRVISMVMTAPVLGAKPVPDQAKVGLSVLIALLLTSLQTDPPPLPSDLLAFALLAVREVVTGLLLGFAATLVFSAAQMAAQLTGVQVGFTFANTMDPLSMNSSGFLETLYNLMAVLIFLGLGGHHALIAGLWQSFELMPVGTAGPALEVGGKLIALTSATFGVAVRLAMPAVGTMLLTDAAMALIVRSIPQMNIFVVGLPVKMVVGILALITLTPMMANGLGSLTRSVWSAVTGVLL